MDELNYVRIWRNGNGIWNDLVLMIGIALLVLIIWLITRSPNQNTTGNQFKSAIDILKERYARGEIDKDEFEEKRSRIE